MNFTLTEERQMLQDSLRRFLQDGYTADLRRSLGEGKNGFSAEIWAGLADLGIVGALFSEAEGGFGGDGFDLARSRCWRKRAPRPSCSASVAVIRRVASRAAGTPH